MAYIPMPKGRGFTPRLVSKALNKFSCVLFVHGTSSFKMRCGVVGQMRVARDTIEAERLNLDD